MEPENFMWMENENTNRKCLSTLYSVFVKTKIGDLFFSHFLTYGLFIKFLFWCSSIPNKWMRSFSLKLLAQKYRVVSWTHAWLGPAYVSKTEPNKTQIHTVIQNIPKIRYSLFIFVSMSHEYLLSSFCLSHQRCRQTSSFFCNWFVYFFFSFLFFIAEKNRCHRKYLRWSAIVW